MINLYLHRELIHPCKPSFEPAAVVFQMLSLRNKYRHVVMINKKRFLKFDLMAFIILAITTNEKTKQNIFPSIISSLAV